MKPKLLIVSDSFLPRWDGVSRFLYELLPHLREDFSITLLVPDFGKIKSYNYLERIRIERVSLSKRTISDYKPAKLNTLEIKKLIKKADIVFTNTLGPLGIQAIIFSKFFRKSVVSFVHSIEWELFSKSIAGKLKKKLVYMVSKPIATLLYNLSDVLIVPTEEVASIMSRNRVLSPKTIVKLGVRTDFFRPPENKSKAKEALGFQDSFVVGFCGRLALEKDPMTVLRAFRLFLVKQKDARLLVVGSGIKLLEDRLSKSRNVVLAGKQDDVRQYYAAMDVFCSASLTETTGLTILESMASGLPVISTKVGISPEIIANGKNGFLVDFKDSYAISKILERLSKDRVFREELGRKARKTIEDNFSWKKTCEGIKNVFQAIPKS
ncbi:MAG TPA: glycosyltransferase family 1 protein [Candidatus Woesearchaeota archaeon]|nr:glycosyltransferase family 1 protein [Candidatus Woesearchaeota archaeon]